MFERFTPQARESVSRAIAEAGHRGDRRVGTDHLLIGILHDPAVAVAVGADAEQARHVADQLDRTALARIGVDVDAFGTLALAVAAPRLPFTAGAKTVLRRALLLVVAGKTRRIESRHLLGALLERREPDPAAVIMAALHRQTPMPAATPVSNPG
jgi:ATP-dependent Clp protease ATP-binding subunit ClpA